MRKKILVVEDDYYSRILLNELLKQSYDVELCSTAEKGQVKLLQFRPDLAIMDIRLPGMNGLELKDWIRDEGTFDNMPIVLVTAENIDHIECDPLTRFFKKPYKFELLTKIINELLDGQRDN